jgi:trehalose synthase
MWKGTPLIAGDVGGIRIQVENGSSGFLVSTPQECAEKMVALLKDSALRDSIGSAARESVRQKFLLPRLALDYLEAAVALAPPARLSGGPLSANGFAASDQLVVDEAALVPAQD